AETEQMPLFALGHGHWDHPQLRELLHTLLTEPGSMRNLELTQTFAQLGVRTLLLTGRQIEQPDTSSMLILLAIEDITARWEAANTLRQAHDVLEQQVQERTSALTATNAALQAEIGEHHQTQQIRQLLVHQLLTTQEDERRHIARELHDQLGQDLTALLLELKSLEQGSAAGAPIGERVAQLHALALQISAEVRSLALQLHPPALEHLGLVATVTNYVEEWSARALVPIDLHMSGLEDARLSAPVEITLYRLIQECLTNILKHAQASDVSLIVERRADAVQLTVEDDGIGFDPASAQRNAYAGRRLGLIGMQERVAQLGGSVSIESEAGRGTTIIVRLPLADAVSGDTDGNTPDLSG
ncbi:MAG TPA: sensor histidine kinase, partial [Roseiflexaceae bacterium]|nr:sensor histidine kinase [Roseiflexaceae bacterium]